MRETNGCTSKGNVMKNWKSNAELDVRRSSDGNVKIGRIFRRRARWAEVDDDGPSVPRCGNSALPARPDGTLRAGVLRQRSGSFPPAGARVAPFLDDSNESQALASITYQTLILGERSRKTLQDCGI